MSTDIKHSPKAQPVSPLPQSPWRSAVMWPSTPAGRFVVRRFGVNPVIADVIAAMAGIGSEARS